MLRSVQPDSRLPVFFAGLAAGLLVVSAFGWSVLTSVKKNGVSVQVEVGPIAAQVEAEVRAAVRREVPAALSAMKAELPARVAEETARKVSGMTVNVGGFNVPVPDVAAQQVKSGVESAVRAGLNVAVTESDLNALSDRLAARAGGMVQQKLVAYLKGRTFPVEVWKGFEIPVTVIPQ
ncbi:MAG TPA: hypothetical protein VNT75_11150 [Symbiobacteriaceae bacterium]|nr:hypothetical protein [Symbiobacteriaceae bacterium]